MIEYPIFFIILCITHLIQGITGFGGIVLALPALAFFFDLKTLLPALVVSNLIQAAWFAWRERRKIHPYHAKSIVFLSLLGLPLGYAFYRYLPADQLKLTLGVFVVLVAVYNLARLEPDLSQPPAARPFYHLLNFLGGFTQGALASGGPFLVIYSARMLPDKSAFRATMMLVWTVLNVVLCVGYTVNRSWSVGMVPLIVLALPTIVFGTVLGQKLHDRIRQKPFRLIIFIILLFSGFLLLRPWLKFLFVSIKGIG